MTLTFSSLRSNLTLLRSLLPVRTLNLVSPTTPPALRTPATHRRTPAWAPALTTHCHLRPHSAMPTHPLRALLLSLHRPPPSPFPSPYPTVSLPASALALRGMWKAVQPTAGLKVRPQPLWRTWSGWPHCSNSLEVRWRGPPLCWEPWEGCQREGTEREGRWMASWGVKMLWRLYWTQLQQLLAHR